MTHEELLKTLEWQLGHRLVSHALEDDDLTIRVASNDWETAGQTLKEALGFRYFTFLSAVDWLPNPGLDGEKTFSAEEKKTVDAPSIVTDEKIRRAGGYSRFQVFGRLYNTDEALGVTITTDLDDETLSVATWTRLFNGADWHERETWEMFGIDFVGHPNLRHIYLPAEFEGFPLRKDFALSARLVRPWPGLVDLEEMPPADDPNDMNDKDAGNKEDVR